MSVLQFDCKTKKFSLSVPVELLQDFTDKTVYISAEWIRELILVYKEKKLGSMYKSEITPSNAYFSRIEIPAAATMNFKSGQSFEVYLSTNGNLVYNPFNSNGTKMEVYKERGGRAASTLKKYEREDTLEYETKLAAMNLEAVQKGLEEALQKRKDKAEERRAYIEKHRAKQV